MAAKINMRLDKNEMPSQDPNVRNKNFLEVALGYTEEQALDEAARCLNCKNHPCVNGCPGKTSVSIANIITSTAATKVTAATAKTPVSSRR